MTVGIEEEDLHVAVAARHRPAFERDAVLGEARARSVEIVDGEREVVRHPALRTRARVHLPGTAGRVRVGEEMDLGSAEPEPGAVECKVGRTLHLREAERLRVEATRPLEVGHDEPDVLQAHLHGAYRNLAPATKEA